MIYLVNRCDDKAHPCTPHPLYHRRHQAAWLAVDPRLFVLSRKRNLEVLKKRSSNDLHFKGPVRRCQFEGLLAK